ncbi:7283_t:CDS:1 [Paraglomus brasilianum]|uniref:7283_t:CDS:1 n=1 Tax=Paraglomus brasilianum TaxID=144538 RepID=A0A9N9H498_9GLOM|nr:7283_t:CDS:1 [Paraglomus brasilianum]
MAKRMRSDAVRLSSEDYKFIMQYRDAKPKSDVLKKLRERYPMTNNRFYKIWRGQEDSMVEWHQPISNSMVSISQDLSIPESHLPDVNQVNIAKNSSSFEVASSNKQSSALLTHQIDENTLHLDYIVTSDKRVKNRKLRSRGIAYPMSQRDAPTGLQSNKSVQISDSSNNGASVKAHIVNKSDIPNTLTKKAEKDDLYTLIERDRKESEVVERESKRILATK